MSDITPPATPPTPAGDAGQPPPAEGQPGPVPYARFAEVNQKYKDLEQRLASIEADRKKADEAALAEQGKYKELLEQRERDLAAEKAARLRLDVATRKGLPAELVDRLRGDDAAALEKDADALLALVKKPGGPGVPPPGGGGTPPVLDLSKMSPAEIRKARAEGKLK